MKCLISDGRTILKGLNVKFKFTENKRFDFGEADEIELWILGQEFTEIFGVDIHSKLDRDRERARLFGMKLQEIGLMIQRQAEKGKTTDIILPNRKVHLF